MNFGSRLKSLREEKKLNQIELSKLLNIANSTLSLYESGTREPNFETLRKIANHFNVTTDYLLGYSNMRNYNGIVAAHRTDDPMNDLPEEAIKSIEEFKKFIFDKYVKNKNSK